MCANMVLGVFLPLHSPLSSPELLNHRQGLCITRGVFSRLMPGLLLVSADCFPLIMALVVLGGSFYPTANPPVLPNQLCSASFIHIMVCGFLGNLDGQVFKFFFFLCIKRRNVISSFLFVVVFVFPLLVL